MHKESAVVVDERLCVKMPFLLSLETSEVSSICCLDVLRGGWLEPIRTLFGFQNFQNVWVIPYETTTQQLLRLAGIQMFRVKPQLSLCKSCLKRYRRSCCFASMNWWMSSNSSYERDLSNHRKSLKLCVPAHQRTSWNKILVLWLLSMCRATECCS